MRYPTAPKFGCCFLDDSCGIAYGNGSSGNRSNHDRTGADGGAIPNGSHYDRRGPNPAIRPYGDGFKLAFRGAADLACFVPLVLPPAAQDLYLGGDLRTVPDGAPSQDAIGSNVYAASHHGIGMSEKRTERHAAIQRALFQSQFVERDTKVVTHNSGNQGTGLSTEWKSRCKTAKPSDRGCGQRKHQEERVQASLS